MNASRQTTIELKANNKLLGLTSQMAVGDKEFIAPIPSESQTDMNEQLTTVEYLIMHNLIMHNQL